MVTKHIAAAILFATLLYAGILPRARRERYVSAVPRESLALVTGCVVSNPVKLSGGRGGEAMYRFDFELERAGMSAAAAVSLGADWFESGARGVISVLYPATLFEAVFPGRLYSAAAAQNSRAIFIDSGIRLTLRGKTTANFFAADSAEYAGGETQRFASVLRSASRLAFRRALYAWGNAGGLFLALVTGSREYTEDRLSALFAAAGLAHVLALSGMHLSIFTGFSSKLGKRAGAKLGALFSLVTVLAFVWFAGFTPSLRRAFLCFLINFCAKLCGKKPPAQSGMMSVLALAFVLHVCAAPAEAASLSFILSYLGLAGILAAGSVSRFLFAGAAYSLYSAVTAKAAAEKMREANAKKTFIFSQKLREKLTGAGRGVCSDINAGAGAFFATAPVTASVFGYLTPVSIASSLVVSPLAAIFIIAGVCCFTLILVFPGLTFFAGRLMNALYNAILACVTFFSRAPMLRLG
ncbi:MAG: hypothetical protein Pg6C_00710 [Treponemataceae bacterium]|nr:MAG: hypothetical protein Pg6C_00710 [Treponemataceae bacterium]